jgi:hypothetical protein
MGASSAQVQSPQSSSGKGVAPSQGQEMSSGKGSQANQEYGTPEQIQGSQRKITFPGQGGQPEMGMPNAYSNTIDQNMIQGDAGQNGMWDNSSKPNGKGSAGASGSSSKGKGA